MTDDIISDLKTKTQSGGRLDEEAPDEEEITLNEFQEEFLKHLSNSEGKVGSRNLSVNDAMMWSVMAALDADDERRQELREKSDADRDTRSSILSKLLRVGLAETYPELAQELTLALESKSDDPFST